MRQISREDSQPTITTDPTVIKKNPQSLMAGLSTGQAQLKMKIAQNQKDEASNRMRNQMQLGMNNFVRPAKL